MRARPTLLILGAPSASQAPFLAQLATRFEVHCQPAFQDALGEVQKRESEVVGVDLREDPRAAVQTLEKLHRADPELRLVAIHDKKDPDLILQAMRAGAREFVLSSEPAELARVFGELAARSSSGRDGGTVVSIFPAKGGLGATTVAANLAGALLEGGRRVVLVDLDFQMGDALVFLDLASRYSILELLANQHRLDGELLTSSLTRHASGLFVLAQGEQVGEAEEPTPADVTRLLGFLAEHFDYVVCDGLRRFDDRSVAALDASHRVLLQLVQNVPAIRNAHRTLEVFRKLGYGASKVGLLVNRFQKNEEISPEDITQHLGLGITGMISNDYRTVMAAVNKGLLLRDAAPRARVTDDIHRLALSLSGSGHHKAGAGFLRSLFGSRTKEGSGHGLERPSEAV